MTLYTLLGKVEDDSSKNLAWFLDFAEEYLDFTKFGESTTPNIQADIVSQNESNYHFIQYKDDGKHCVTRPINSSIFIKARDFSKARQEFEKAIPNIRDIKKDIELRKTVNSVIYTCQQCIGCTLDALNNSNKAKKKNGNYFEILIRDTVKSCGINIDDKDEILKQADSNETMKFEHDIILLNEKNEEKAIGQLKTSSKDRIDKIFFRQIHVQQTKKNRHSTLCDILERCTTKGKQEQSTLRNKFDISTRSFQSLHNRIESIGRCILLGFETRHKQRQIFGRADKNIRPIFGRRHVEFHMLSR